MIRHLLSVFFIWIICTSSFVAQNLTTSLVACYPLDGNAFEPVNLLTGTLGAVTPTVDRFNNSNSALAFSGSTLSYVTLPNSPFLKPTNAVSISMWIKPSATGLQHVVYVSNGCSSYFEAYCIGLGQSGNSQKIIVTKSGSCNANTQGITIGATTINTGTWYHVGAYFGTDSIKVYVNGVLDASSVANWAFLYNSSANVLLASTGQSFWNYPYAGSMDNLKFYNRKLSGQEFASLYSTDPTCMVPMPPTSASFNSPDTVCINQSFTPQNTSSGSITTSYWNTCGSTVAPVTSTATVMSGSPPFTTPAYEALVNDNGNYHMFVTNNVSSQITRLDFGTNLNSTPLSTNIGTMTSSPDPLGIYIHKEGNNWIGLLTGATGHYINRLHFGNSITNTPTVSTIGTVGGMNSPHNIFVFNNSGNYYAFVLNRGNNSITRLFFGNSLTQTPSAVNFTTSASLSLNAPSQMEIISYAGNWHAFICNEGNNSITRLDFGSTLLGVPTATNLGNPGNLLDGPRGISLYSDCNGIKGYIANRLNSNLLLQVSIPTATAPLSLSNSGILANLNFAQSLKRVRVGNDIIIFAINAGNNTVTKIIFPTCNAVPSSTLSTPSPITFTTAGSYTINLANNENLPSQSATCKKIVAIGPFTVSASATSTVSCGSQPITLSASGASSYTWYPGPLSGNNVTVAPSSTTIYTVVGAKGSCTAVVTITIVTLPGSTVNVTANPPSICVGMSSTLTATGAVTYSWQPGNLSGNIQIFSPFATTMYSVSGTNSLGCITSKTIALQVTAYPIITFNPGSATVCTGSNATITANGAASYTWLPGNMQTAAVVIAPAVATIYTVTGNTNNCVSTSTIAVGVATSPTVTISVPVQSICPGGTVTISATGASSYTWLPGNLTGSNITVNPSSTTIYTAIGGNGICTARAHATVVVMPTPVINASASPAVICRGSVSTLNASGASTYTWIPGTIIASSTTVSPFSTTIYTVTGTGANGCRASASIQVSVNPVPTVAINPSSQTICAGPVTLTASGANAYFWQPGGSTNAVLVTNLSSNIVFTVTGTSNNCASTATAFIAVNPIPVINIAVSHPSICAGGSSTLTASGAANYTWLPGNATTQTIAVTPSVSMLYTVIGVSSAACTGSAQTTVLVQSNPLLNITAFPSSTMCTNTPFTLTANGAANYTWSPGNVNASTYPTILQTGGTFSYTVIGSAAGCTATATRTILSVVTPTIFAIATPTMICNGQQLVLNAGGAASYVWQTPNFVSGASLTVTPTSSFVYTVTGYNGNCTDKFFVPVTVLPRPVLTIVSSNNPMCAGSTATLLASGASSYTWSPGGSTGNIIVVSPSVSTLYSVIGMNNAGCTATVQFPQVVNPTPTMNIAVSQTNICAGTSVTIACQEPPNSFTLHPGNQAGNIFVVTPLTSTTYTIVRRANGCFATRTIAIIVNPAINLVVTATPGTVCAGSQAILNASGANSYTWYPGPIGVGATVFVNPLVTTVYTVFATGTGGCIGNGNITVNVVTSPTVFISASSSSICAGQSTTLSASGAVNYVWQPGGMTSNMISVAPNVTTDYTVYGSSGSCISPPAIMKVFVGQYPSLTVQVSKNNICSGERVIMSAFGASNYTWQPDMLTGQTVTINPIITSTYTLVGDDSGCPSRVPVTINVSPSPNLFVNATSTLLCLGDSSYITAIGADTYTILPLMINDPFVMVKPTVSTTYTILGGNTGTCVSVRTIPIDVIAPPVFSLSGSNVICSGQSITVSAGGPGNFLWLPGNLTGSTVTLTPSTTTSYTVIQTAGTCSFSSVFTVTVTSCDGPVFGLTNAASTPVLRDGNYYLINFTVIAVNNAPIELHNIRLNNDLAATFPYPCTYTVLNAPQIHSKNSALKSDGAYDGRNNLSLTSPSASTLLPNKRDTLVLSILVAPNGFYGPVKNIVVGTADSPGGFQYADSSNNGFVWDPDHDGDPTNNNEFTVIDIKKIDLFIPEGFSPNDDGRNDEFIIKGTQGRKAKLLIFNRWGNKLFEQEGSDLRWDGKAQFGLVIGNSTVPAGTYYYILQYLDGGKESRNGFIEVHY